MSYKIDKLDFQRNMKRYEKELRQQVIKNMRLSIGQGVTASSKKVPPLKAEDKANIPAKMYKRPVLSLRQNISKKGKFFQSDYNALRQGKLFKVQYKSDGKNVKKIWYFKTERQAKKYARIVNRGLWRFSFGARLAEVLNIQMPSVFQKLLQKSPNLSKHKDFNTITEKISDNISISVKNTIRDNEKFYKAKSHGEKVGQTYFKKLMREYAKKRVQV